MITKHRRPANRLLLGSCFAALLALAAPSAAQEQAAPTEAESSTDATTDPAGAPDLLEPNEIDALVAPVVLYPDPLLSLVLQASITPLDLVEAERFLGRREKDPALTPDADWDESVVGLLNYPELVSSMSEYLDWTQLLGTAVVEQIDAVQASIQILRLAAVDRGILVSNDVQKVVETDGVVMVAPASKDTMSVPQYDPVELLAALTPAEEVPPATDAAGTTVIVNVQQPSTPAQPPAAEPDAPAPAEPPAAEAPAAVAEAAPAPVATAAPAPTYYAEPTYAAPPPPVSYGAPQSTFWSTAATFAGGAAVGGLLGYVWGDDDDDDNDNDDGWDDVEDAIRDLDDDDWDDFVDRIDEDDFDDAVDRLNDRDWDEVREGRGRDVNISDSTIVVGNDVKRNQLDAKLKNKRDAKVNLTGGQRTRVDMKNGTLKREGDTRVAAVNTRARDGRGAERPRGLAPVNATRERGQQRQAAANRQARDVKLPGAKGASVGSAGGGRPAAAQSRPQQAQGAQRRQAQTTRRPGDQPQAANRAVASGVDRPREAQRASQRGAASKAKAGAKKSSQPKAAQRAGGGQRTASANRGGSRPMGGVKSGASTRRDANRGSKSLGKSGGRKGGGGRQGGGRRN